MTDSDQPSTQQSPLAKNVRKTKTLWTAWTSIRTRALRSGNRKTRDDARRIDQNPNTEIRRLQEALRSGTFRFKPQQGVVQKRQGKAPRPIVVSPVTNRIVQRAILDTLQTRSQRLRGLLGDVPISLTTPTSVGGIPGRGAKDAVELIKGAIGSGAIEFIRSDIKDFFMKVPKAQLLAELKEQTGDAIFVQLLAEGLEVELANANEPEVKEWRDLFPNEETGVPQGSSLSAFCANYVLREFDAKLNQRGITMVRYIDDFVILGRTEGSVQKAWRVGLGLLQNLGLEVHQPTTGGKKASSGKVNSGFDFLSYHFVGSRVGVSREAKARLKASIDEQIRQAKREIIRCSGEPRRSQDAYAQTLVALDRKVRGWGDAFRDTTNRVEFNQLDDWISTKVEAFQRWYMAQSRGLSPEEQRRLMGVALLADTPPGS